MPQTSASQQEQDLLANFLAEVCITDLAEARVRSSALLSAYTQWSGDRWMTASALARKLKERGFTSKKSGGVMYWHGIGLPQEEDTSFTGTAL